MTRSLLFCLSLACAGATRDTDTDGTDSDTADTADSGDTSDTGTELGPVVVNELLAGNSETNSWTDPNDGQQKFDDWFELFNRSNEEVDLTDWQVTDGLDEGKTPWKFPKDTRIAPGTHLLVWASEADEEAPGLHSDFKLSKDGETLHLLDPDDEPVDVVTFGAQSDDVSWYRAPDGSANWKAGTPTPGTTNGN